MSASDELIKICANEFGWKCSFDGQLYQGIGKRTDWIHGLPLDQSLHFQLGQEITTTIPFLTGGLDYILACTQNKEYAYTRGIAIVHPSRVKDSQDEILYAALLHLTLIPSIVPIHLTVPAEYAKHVNENHLTIMKDPVHTIHPQHYHISPLFRTFPHPLQVLPVEGSHAYALLARKIGEKCIQD